MSEFTRRQIIDLMGAGVAGTFVACSRARPDVGGTNPVVGPEHKPTAYLRTNWSQDPLALGAYSYVSRRSPGTGESDRAALEAPIDGRIFFAGEALNPNFHGTVHAAHESGLRAVAEVNKAERTRVAVIGAGMAGLTAAARLTEAGKTVSVYEARDRLGGRIQTDRSLGAPVDLGATWIHGPEGNPLTKLADQSKMPRRETDDTIIVRGAGGRELGWMTSPSWLEEVFQWTPTGAKPSDINQEYLSKVFPRYGLGYPGPDLLLPEGYDQILKSLAGDYRVRLSSSVTRVESSSSGVKLTLRGGQVEAFDAVIVTVPLGVLKAGSITFEPPLPTEKQVAIKRMGMGVLDKLYLRFNKVFWDDVTIILTPENGLARGRFNYWVNFHRYLGEPILMAFHAADAAKSLAGMPDEAVLEQAARTLASAYPQTS